jgi:hypothetical protein
MVMKRTSDITMYLFIFAGIMIMNVSINAQAYARLVPLTSKDLADVVAISGKATLLEEKPITWEGQKIPSLYQRRFKLEHIVLLRGNLDGFQKEKAIIFSGYTNMSSNQRSSEVRSPLLGLESQYYFDNFFDKTLPSGQIDVLLLIGKPDILPIMGFMGHSASVEEGMLKGQPVRAFLIKDWDAKLRDAIPLLLGWQKKVTPETIQAVIQAPHPLIALDALCISALDKTIAYTKILAQWLLHPAQPSGVKATAVALIALAIRQFPEGSKEADELIDILSSGWEAEQTYNIELAYLRSLLSVPEYIKKTGRRTDMEGIADDYQIKELERLAGQLADILQGKK